MHIHNWGVVSLRLFVVIVCRHATHDCCARILHPLHEANCYTLGIFIASHAGAWHTMFIADVLLGMRIHIPKNSGGKLYASVVGHSFLCMLPAILNFTCQLPL